MIAGLKVNNPDNNISHSSINSNVPTAMDISNKTCNEKKEINIAKRFDMSIVTSAERQFVNFSDIAFTERSACPSQDRVIAS